MSTWNYNHLIFIKSIINKWSRIIGCHKVKSKFSPIFILIPLHKSYLQMGQRPHFETWNAKTVRRKHSQDISVGKDFPKRIPFSQRLRPTINTWEFLKLKSIFYQVKETINQIKKPQNGRKFLSATYLIKD